MLFGSLNSEYLFPDKKFTMGDLTSMKSDQSKYCWYKQEMQVPG